MSMTDRIFRLHRYFLEARREKSRTKFISPLRWWAAHVLALQVFYEMPCYNDGSVLSLASEKGVASWRLTRKAKARNLDRADWWTPTGRQIKLQPALRD